MQRRMTPASPSPGTQAPQRLAEANLPRRVRVILDHVMDVASDELERLLQAMLGELEQQLFRLADHARNPGVESEYLHTLRTLRLNRSDLVPRFMIGLEGSLASLGQSVGPVQPTAPAWSGGHNLSLIDDAEMDETTVLRDIAARHSSRSSFALHLLGQRFGVLAASPALDIERLPCAPHSLCAILRDSVETLQLPLDARLLLYRTFDRLVMSQHAQLAETINALFKAEVIDRRILLAGLASTLLIAEPALHDNRAALIWNASASLPIGLYRLALTPPIEVGDIVVVRPPEPLAGFLTARGYLPRGVPLMKRVQATAGAVVSGASLRATPGRRPSDPVNPATFIANKPLSSPHTIRRLGGFVQCLGSNWASERQSRKGDQGQVQRTAMGHADSKVGAMPELIASGADEPMTNALDLGLQAANPT